ncbi:MAG: AI-2E family transporter [Alphaproteobacteria bacterium]
MFKTWFDKFTYQDFAVLSFLLLAAASVTFAFGVVVEVVVAVWGGLLLFPMAKRLQGWLFGSWGLAILATMLILLVGFGVFLYLILPGIIEGAQALVKLRPQLEEQLKPILDLAKEKLKGVIPDNGKSEMTLSDLFKLLTSSASTGTNTVASIGGKVLAVLGFFAKGFITFAVMLIFLLNYHEEEEKALDFVNRALPAHAATHVQDTLTMMLLQSRMVLKGLALIMFVFGLFFMAVLHLVLGMTLQQASLYGIVLGVLGTLPAGGGLMAGGVLFFIAVFKVNPPWALADMLTLAGLKAWALPLGMALLGKGVNFAEAKVMTPKFIGRPLGYSPVATIAAMLLSLSMGGIGLVFFTLFMGLGFFATLYNRAYCGLNTGSFKAYLAEKDAEAYANSKRFWLYQKLGLA